MSIERLLALAIFGLSAALLVRLAPSAIRVWLVYSGTSDRRQEDATGRAPVPSPDVVERMGVLARNGYHTIGETRLMLPVGERFARIMAADDGESYAILTESRVPAAGLTGLYAAWPDGTWLGTLHPRGNSIERAGLRLRVAMGTLPEAVESHLAEARSLRVAHGRPRRIERMADMLALDADYRRRFGGRELRPIVARALFPVGVALALTAISIALIAVSPR